VAGADVVVVSTAVSNSTTPRWSLRRAARIPVVPRALMLAELMRLKQGIARRRHPRQDHHHQPGGERAGRGRRWTRPSSSAAG
jgi:hypothetical protein